GVRYYFIVNKVVGGVESQAFAGVSAIPNGTTTVTTTPPPTTTVTPTITNSVAVTPGNGQVALSWPNASGAAYNVYWATTASMDRSIPTKRLGVTGPQTITGLSRGVKYYFLVNKVSGSSDVQAFPEVSAAPN